MKATTETDRRTTIISWCVAACVAIGLALGLYLMPKPDNANIKPPKQEKAKRVAKKDKKKKKRPLPKDYIEKLIDSSELLVKQELKKRLKRFDKMAKQFHAKEAATLKQIENRPLASGASPSINDTSFAHKKIPDTSLGPDPSVENLYARLAEYEADILENHISTKAAEKSLKEGLSFQDTLRNMQSGFTQMPKYQGLVETVNEQHHIKGKSKPIRSIEDINRYRDLLGQTTRQSALAESRLLSLVTRKFVKKPPPPPPNSNSVSQGKGTNGEDGVKSKIKDLKMIPYNAKFENEAMVRAQALPGRRISKSAKRRGWLFVNTWYMIGPWESHGVSDFSATHPPEQGIDFDAVYHDGQKGIGLKEADSHPLQMIGEKVVLDGKLSWKFMQSESMHNTVPVTTDSSTYYAYTELYFEEAAVMVVAIGTDDSGKLWINDKEIWKDSGSSWYHLDEHVENFQFKQGWNRILIRLENNGGAAAGFSFLICPKEVALITRKKK